MTRSTLGKNERLKSRKLIGQLFSNGKNFYSQPYKVYYLLTGEPFSAKQPGVHVQFGVSVPTKNFKKAVDRNRLKRLTREAYRIQKKDMEQIAGRQKLWLYLFFIYIDPDLCDFNTIKTKVGVALKKILQRTHHDHPENT